ncbi:MAG TPA: YebC/PmpR family DNA-binding transcriptional regulator [Candidatus Krumholzibacteria bacterium]|jgi:YebC/PmpR family DNA-binding regulatory protein|nr:YebC/PmpR family DNA-binding transcriptional regulator [Candidatus Krumholzibacteria bacterium]
MSGHSKWSQIKHKKAKTDSVRGKVFTKLIREITIASRQGGPDPNGNPRLRLAIQTAKEANMPADNITRAIKKGAGELEGQMLEEWSYEGYGPAGVALIIDVVSDNRNRTTSEVRHALTKHNGNLGENGAVAWNFETKGVITVDRKGLDEDTIMSAALEAGAADVSDEGEVWEVYTDPTELSTVSEALKKGGIATRSAEVQRVPKTYVKLDGEDARKVIKLVEMLEELDDVQRVSANFDIPDEILQSG